MRPRLAGNNKSPVKTSTFTGDRGPYWCVGKKIKKLNMEKTSGGGEGITQHQLKAKVGNLHRREPAAGNTKES